MKTNCFPRMFWWVIVVILLMAVYSCRGGRPGPAPAPSAPPPAPSAPAPTPSKTAPPPQQPLPPSAKPGAPPPKEVTTLPPEKTLSPDETFFTHTVKWSGETLFIIAAWYTGDRDHWREIAQAMTRENPNVNIHRIRAGDKIPVPESLMKRRDSMPKEFVETFIQPSKPEKPPAKPAPAEKEDEEPKLFGPKEFPKK